MNSSIQNPLPLVLGTAQLGMDYGIANRIGKPSFDNAIEMVATAWELGIRMFDTARAYGNSEEILGGCFQELGLNSGKPQPAVISKLDPSIDLLNRQAILRQVDDSLKKLRLESLWGLLLHRESLLEGAVGLFEGIILELKRTHGVKFFGASLYSIEKAFKALEMDEIDLIQMPFNVFDQRASDAGLFRLAGEKGKKIFVRSIYLQGLLLLDLEQIPAKLDFAFEKLKRFSSVADRLEIPRKTLALAYVAQKAQGCHLVIGAESASQVRENVISYQKAAHLGIPDLGFLSSKDPRLINPTLWNI